MSCQNGITRDERYKHGFGAVCPFFFHCKGERIATGNFYVQGDMYTWMFEAKWVIVLWIIKFL